jgi:hypothetical protein
VTLVFVRSRKQGFLIDWDDVAPYVKLHPEILAGHYLFLVEEYEYLDRLS